LKVIDFSTAYSGPITSQNLGDLGFDVIKVEPMRGDLIRHVVPPERAGLGGWFAQVNRNKRSIVVDLKSDEGRMLVLRLVERADVVLENYRPGVADRLGVGYEACKERNPGIVYAAISGFGPTGPYAKLPVYDHIIQGMSGMMPRLGGDGPPKMFPGILADKYTPAAAVIGILSALLSRERNGGKGQRVDIPMLDAYAQLMLPDQIASESFQPTDGFESNMRDVFRSWKTKDGYVVGYAPEDHQFAGLCKALEAESLLEDPRFATYEARMANPDAVNAEIEKRMLAWTSEEFVARAREYGAPFGPIYGIAEFLEDPQVAHNETVFDAEDPQGGRARYVGYPCKFSETPASLRRHPPRLGEHTDEILGDLGFSSDDIEGLREAAVVK
jgi:crotonobetainyl-CoA:carnitine CoA-transferase CaiB-like acyl-CoA transferase